MHELVKDSSIFYICNDPERAFGLENVLDNFHIVCIDNSPSIEPLRKAGAKVFSLAEALGDVNPLQSRNSYRLLQHELVQNYIKENTPEGGQAYIQVFKVAKNIEILAKNLGYEILNPSAELNQMFENKISQYELLAPHVNNFPKTVITELGKSSFEELYEELGDNFVVQFDRGHTGSGTIFVETKDVYKNLQEKFPNRIVRVSRNIEGDVWTINACITRYGVLVDGLSFQITGIPELISEKGGTVGNDWSLATKLSDRIKNKIEQLTKEVGHVMQDAGFKGLFGIDFIITPAGELVLIEVNARQTASVSMHNKLRSREGLVPFSAFHVAEFMFSKNDLYDIWLLENFGVNVETISSESINLYNASQVFIRNSEGKVLIIPNKRKQSAYSIENVDYLEIYVQKGQFVTPGGEIGRVQQLEPAVVNGQLNGDVVEKLRKLVK